MFCVIQASEKIGLLGEIAREANRYGINFLYNQ